VAAPRRCGPRTVGGSPPGGRSSLQRTWPSSSTCSLPTSPLPICDARDPWLLLVSSTVADPARAPAGHETLKLLTVAPYTLSGGGSWAARAEEHAAALMALVRRRTGLSESDILAVVPETPVGLAARNPANLQGSCHGGEFGSPDGATTAGWMSYRASLPGLFLTGSTTHPGGSVSGRPGRNAARTILTDLGIDPGLVMGAP